MRIAVFNAGSGTIKAALVEVSDAGPTVLRRSQHATPDARDRTDHLRAAFDEIGALDGPVGAAGHRVVHGGRRLTRPVRIDDAVESEIEALAPIAPQHNPPALEGIRLARRLLPDRPNVAVFDTGFPADRSAVSKQYALPSELAETSGLIRYGFHGIAHASLLNSLARAELRPEEELDAVTLQLGGGCSACAIQAGRSVETSMGFSPVEGLMMATRSGDVDPSVVLELVAAGRTVEEVREILTHRSGLRGLAGEADMREVRAAAEAGDPRAELALSLFVRRIVATVGAYWTLLGGHGSLVFGGGIGTNSPVVRQRVADGLGAWDVRLDPERNAAGRPGPVHAAGSRPVYVFETDEERLIARDVHRLVAGEA